jgi:hypothetical protein
MRCHMAIVRTDVWKERVTIIRMERISKLGNTQAVNVVPNSLILITLLMEAIRSFEKSVLTRVIRRHIPVGGILQRCSQ